MRSLREMIRPDGTYLFFENANLADMIAQWCPTEHHWIWKKGNEFYYEDETGQLSEESYPTLEDAKREFNRYCEWLNNPNAVHNH